MSQGPGAPTVRKRRLVSAAIAVVTGVALVFGFAATGLVAFLVVPPPVQSAFEVADLSCRVVDADVAYVSFAVAPQASGETSSTRVDNVEVAGAMVTGVGTLPPDFALDQAEASDLPVLVPAPEDDFWDVEVDDRSAVVVLRLARDEDAEATVGALDLIFATGEPEYRQRAEVGLLWERDVCRVGVS